MHRDASSRRSPEGGAGEGLRRRLFDRAARGLHAAHHPRARRRRGRRAYSSAMEFVATRASSVRSYSSAPWVERRSSATPRSVSMTRAVRKAVACVVYAVGSRPWNRVMRVALASTPRGVPFSAEPSVVATTNSTRSPAGCRQFEAVAAHAHRSAREHAEHAAVGVAAGDEERRRAPERQSRSVACCARARGLGRESQGGTQGAGDDVLHGDSRRRQIPCFCRGGRGGASVMRPSETEADAQAVGVHDAGRRPGRVEHQPLRVHLQSGASTGAPGMGKPIDDEPLASVERATSGRSATGSRARSNRCP